MSTYKLTGILNSIDTKSIILGCSDDAMVKLNTLKKRMLPNDAKIAETYKDPIRNKSVRITFRKTHLLNVEYFMSLLGERVTLMCKYRKYSFKPVGGLHINGWVLNLSNIEKSY